MRFFDESLEKVIIVDDNPLRLFQFRNVRVYKEALCRPLLHRTRCNEKSAIEAGMKTVTDEIVWAVKQMETTAGLGFAQAYLPFTVLGQITVSWLMSSGDGMQKKACYIL